MYKRVYVVRAWHKGESVRSGVTDPVVHGMAWQPLSSGHHLFVRYLQLADVATRVGLDAKVNHHISPPTPVHTGIKCSAVQWWKDTVEYVWCIGRKQ